MEAITRLEVTPETLGVTFFAASMVAFELLEVYLLLAPVHLSQPPRR